MKQIATYIFISTFLFSLIGLVALSKSDTTIGIVASDSEENTSSLVCISFLQLSLGQNGVETLTPDMLLAENYPSYDQFDVSIVDPPIFTDVVDCSLVGETIMVEVINTVNGQKCWSNVLVEDKLSPVLNCDTINVDCTFDLFYNDIDSLLPNLEDNCTSREDLTVTFNQQQISQNCQSNYVLILDRSWYVEDEQGNSSVCNQIIRLERPLISDVEFPENDTIYCPNFNIDPAQTGFPTYNGEEISFICGLAAWEDDVIIPQCGNTFKVMRTWSVADWCANTTRTQLQQIFILDTVGPVIPCPADQTISNTPFLCGAEYMLPDVNVVDSCSDSQDISLVYSVNNTLYNVGELVSLDVGVTTIELEATDPCGNTSICAYDITVLDNESPTVVCADQNVSLESNGIAEVTPFTFNSFSYTDNCGIEEVLIRRMDDNCDRPDDMVLGPNIQFCCEDIGQNVMVEVQAIDVNGLVGSCMFEVEVQDKLPPVVDCPSDLTISCDQLSNDLFDYGDADITDNCSFSFDYSEEIFLNGCKEGSIFRKWVAVDSSGNTDSCTQVITVFNPFDFDPNSIVWPADTVIAECNILPSDIETSPEFEQTPCETVSVSFSDMTLDPDSTCLDVMRQWVIVDSCTGLSYERSQMIRILNNNNPILTVPDDVTLRADGNCQAQASLPAAVVNECSSGVQFVNSYTSQGAMVDTLFELGSTSILFTATDQCGNSSTGLTIVTVIDDTPPIVSCPADTTVENDPGECGAFIEFPDPIVSDNCEVASVVVDYTDSINASGFYPVGETLVSIIVTDGAGLSDTCSFLVEVTDSESPVLTCPLDTQVLFLDELCQAEVPDVNGLISFEDNCSETGDISVVQNPVAGEILMMVQDTFIQVVIADESGNTDTCEIQIALRDTLPPDIMCPYLDTLDVFVDEDCAYILEDFTSEAMIMSNCTEDMDIEVIQIPSPGTVLMGGDTTVLITLQAEDLSGNVMECDFPLELNDTILPNITCPQDIIVSTDPGVCEADVSIDIPAVSDNCELEGFSNDFTGTEDASGVYPLGTTVVIYTVTDATGNVTTCSFTVTVEDEEAPNLECPEPFMLVLDLNCEGEIPDLQDSIEVSDNCTLEQDITYTQSPTAGDPVSGVGVRTVTITVSDSSGNSTTCEVDIEYVDETAPELDCPDDIIVEADEECVYVLEDFTGQAIVTDNCTNSTEITVTQDPIAGTELEGVGEYDITITATDESGNSSTCVFVVEIIDVTDPEITCPQDIIVSTDPGVCEADVSIDIPAVSDNCELEGFSNNFTGTEDASGVYSLGTTVVVYTVTDASGNVTTCSFTVTVEDEEAPVLTCPQDLTIALDNDCEALIPDVSGLVDYSDNCTLLDSITFNQSPPAGDLIEGPQDITVTVIIADSVGNTASCDIVITFADTLPVEIVCPVDQTEYFDENCEFLIPDYRDSASVVSSCTDPDSIQITQFPPSQTLINGAEVGDSIVEITLIAQTNGGESDTCMFNLTILDTIPSVLTCAPDTTVYLDANCEVVIPDLIPELVVEDNCISDIGFTAVQTPPAGDVIFGEDTVTISFIVAVDNGDTLTCESELMVLDTISPMLSCPQVENVTLDINCQGLIPDFSDAITAEDNCTPEQELGYVQNPPAGDPFSGVGSTTVLITITDNSGNTATCEVEVNFIDETAPELDCPDDITVEADVDCSYLVEDFTSQVIVTDNCSNSTEITLTQDPAVGEELTGVGIYDITITATDSSGNIETCTFTIEVIDETPPMITCPDDITVSTDPGVCEADVQIDLPTNSDNCGVESVINDYTNVENASGIYPEGTTTVIYTVTDESGNEVSCSFTVTVEDNEAPVLSCPQDSIIPLDMDCEGLIPDVSGWVDYSDNCTLFDSIEFTQSPPAGDLVEGPQDITLTVTVTDSVGNSAFCDIVITFTDTLPVEIVCPENQTEFFDENCEFVLPDYRDSAEVVSSCTDPDSIQITQFPPAQTLIDGAEVGDSTVEITLIVETNGGEADTCMFDLTILDTIPAVLTCAPDANIFVNEDCQGIIPDLTPELSVDDNCITDIGFTAIQNPPAGGILLAGDVVTITFTVFVDNGDTLSCESELTVLDSISPEISCPDDLTIILNEDCEVSIPDFNGEFILDPGCEDSLNIDVVQFPAPGDYPSFSGEEIEVILVASNPFNNTTDTCAFLVTTLDTIAPLLECSSAGLVLDLDEDCSALIPDVTAEIVSLQDNCTEEQNIQITQMPPVDSVIASPEGPIEVEIIAEDGNGNTASCFITIEFEDNLPPTIICPPDTMVPCQFDIDSTEQFGQPQAFDNCSDVTITFSNQFFSSNACTVDSLKRVFTATDESGNSSSCTQTVIFDGANPNLTENDFIFNDTVFTQDCDLTDPEDILESIPELDPDLEVCKVINTSFEDGPIRDSDFGCQEFDRTWTLIDSCANLTDPNDGIFVFDQLVVINDTVSPEINVPFLDTIIYIDSCGTMAEIDFPPATASDCVGIDTLFNNSPFADSNAGGDISGTYEEGVYEITITAEDSCGNQTAQMINLIVSDTSDLEFTCTFKVEKPFDTTTFMVPYFISEMVDGLVNSCGNEPAGLIEFSVDPDDPTDTVIIVTCEDFGMAGTEFVENVQVYAFIDGVLVDSCTTIIAITDNVIDCMIEALGGGVVDVNQEPFEEVQVNLSGVDTGMTYTDNTGYFEFDELLRGGYYSLSCDFEGDPVAGVSTFDILLIQRYILGFGELENPYSLIAADVDKNRRITGKDIIHLRRVILGIDSEMPVDNWRFIPATHEFANPERAYASNYPESIFVESLQATIMNADFVGVKVGDVNGSISPGARGRTGQEFWNAEHSSENQIDFYVQETGRVFGFQFEIPASVASNLNLLDGQIKWNDYEISRGASGKLTVSWSDPYGRILSAGDPIFSLSGSQVRQLESFKFGSDKVAPQIYREGEVLIKSLGLHWISGPQNYALHQNRPNPFVDRTIIPFELPEAEKVELHVHDNSGRMVYEAKIEGKRGYNEFELNSDRLASGGTYHYTLRAKNFIASKVLVVAEP